MILANIFAASVFWALGIWFGAAIPRHFRQENRSVWLSVLMVSGAIVAALYLIALFQQPGPAWRALLALIPALAAGLLFRCSIFVSRDHGLFLAFSGRAPETLLQSGPYAYMRHPLYSAYILFWLGVGIHAWTVGVAIGVCWLTALYVAAALVEERQLLRSAMGCEYASYRRKVGLIAPHIRVAS